MPGPSPILPAPCHTLPNWRSAVTTSPLSGPYAGVEPGQTKKFGAMFFEDCLRILGVLDHFLRLVAFKARHLRDSYMYLPWFPSVCDLTDRALALPIFNISELFPVFRNAHKRNAGGVRLVVCSASCWQPPPSEIRCLGRMHPSNPDHQVDPKGSRKPCGPPLLLFRMHPNRRPRRAHSLSPNPGRNASPICPDLIYDRHRCEKPSIPAQ